MSAGPEPAVDDTRAPASHGATFWIGLVLGAAIMAFGIRGLLDQVASSTAWDVGTWVVGADLVHDLLLAPVAILIGWAFGRVIPSRVRAPVQAGLVATGVALVVGWAPLRGYGRDTVPDNPTVQPLNYATAFATVLVVIWALVALWIVVRVVRARRAGP